jgi:hypothetical protein|tara:strand:+ start:164 stop:436 length:273 start_codon:yes stop_codon:yes gene_type:complete
MSQGEEQVSWWNDPMVLIGLILPTSLWGFMYFSISLEAAWISLPCGALVGFFLWLIALGYENPRMAKTTIIGVLINTLLALFSAYYAFLR